MLKRGMEYGIEKEKPDEGGENKPIKYTTLKSEFDLFNLLEIKPGKTLSEFKECLQREIKTANNHFNKIKNTYRELDDYTFTNAKKQLELVILDKTFQEGYGLTHTQLEWAKLLIMLLRRQIEEATQKKRK